MSAPGAKQRGNALVAVLCQLREHHRKYFAHGLTERLLAQAWPTQEWLPGRRINCRTSRRRPTESVGFGN